MSTQNLQQPSGFNRPQKNFKNILSTRGHKLPTTVHRNTRELDRSWGRKRTKISIPSNLAFSTIINGKAKKSPNDIKSSNCTIQGRRNYKLLCTAESDICHSVRVFAKSHKTKTGIDVPEFDLAVFTSGCQNVAVD